MSVSGLGGSQIFSISEGLDRMRSCAVIKVRSTRATPGVVAGYRSRLFLSYNFMHLSSTNAVYVVDIDTSSRIYEVLDKDVT